MYVVPDCLLINHPKVISIFADVIIGQIEIAFVPPAGTPAVGQLKVAVIAAVTEKLADESKQGIVVVIFILKVVVISNHSHRMAANEALFVGVGHWNDAGLGYGSGFKALIHFNSDGYAPRLILRGLLRKISP